MTMFKSTASAVMAGAITACLALSFYQNYKLEHSAAALQAASARQTQLELLDSKLAATTYKLIDAETAIARKNESGLDKNIDSVLAMAEEDHDAIKALQEWRRSQDETVAAHR